MEIWIAFAIFAGFPIAFVGWLFWVVYATEPEELYPFGDATEREEFKRNVRRVLHKEAANENR